jgi:hypothetical protein
VSDFNSNAPVPPPPPVGAAPLPPGYIAPPGYGGYPTVAAKPPRPAVPVGAWLLIVGGVAMAVATFLNWYTIESTLIGDSVDINGYDDTFDPETFETFTNTGAAFMMFAIVSAGFGIAQLFAKRVLSVAIIAVVFASVALIVWLGEWALTSDRKDNIGSLLADATLTLGPGLWVLLVGAVVSLAGAITTLARRRRWSTGAGVLGA